MKKKIGYILFGIAFIVLLIFAGICAKNLFDEKANEAAEEAEYSKIAEEFVDIPESKPSEEYEGEDPTLAALRDNYNRMLSINPDYACWISLKGLGLEYPVVFEPNNSNYYYLNHNFNKKRAGCGCLFIDPDCPNVDCDNIIIYGHHMRNGTMFGNLGKYLKESFVSNEENRIIELYTETEHRYYEVVCVFTTNLYRTPINWNNYVTLETPEKFQEFVQKYTSASTIDFSKISNTAEPKFDVFGGIQSTENTFGNRFITLITCEYSHRNGREIVIAREINK